MTRKITATLFLLVLLSIIKVHAADSTATIYKNGTFITHYQVRTKASAKVAGLLADDFVNQFNSTPNVLFKWALKGLGLEGQKNNELKLNLKSATFDPKTGITHGVVDVLIPSITSFNDVAVDARVTKSVVLNGGRKVQADVLYSRFLIDKAIGYFILIPQVNNEIIIVTNLTIKFGWFFNIFITQQRYKSIVEWRVQKFTENLKIDIDKRSKLVESRNE